MKSTLCPKCRTSPDDVEHVCVMPGRFPVYLVAVVEVVPRDDPADDAPETFGAFLEVCSWDASAGREPVRLPVPPRVKHVVVEKPGEPMVSVLDGENVWPSADAALEAVEQRVARAILNMGGRSGGVG